MRKLHLILLIIISVLIALLIVSITSLSDEENLTIYKAYQENMTNLKYIKLENMRRAETDIFEPDLNESLAQREHFENISGTRQGYNFPLAEWHTKVKYSSLYSIRSGVMHHGIDLVYDGAGNIENAVVYAIGSGTVYSVKWSTGGGNTVTIQHPDGYVSVYMHMGWADQSLQGTEIEAGDPIGFVGTTGLPNTAHHLHIEIYVGNQSMDYLRFINEEYWPAIQNGTRIAIPSQVPDASRVKDPIYTYAPSTSRPLRPSSGSLRQLPEENLRDLEGDDCLSS